MEEPAVILARILTPMVLVGLPIFGIYIDNKEKRR